MKNSLTLLFMMAVVLGSALSACQQKSTPTGTEIKKGQTKEVLFLTLKTFKTEKGINAELIEQSIREDHNNPLGTPNSAEGDTFKCEILNQEGFVIYTSVRTFAYKYKTKEDIPYAFLKFSESLPSKYYSCVVSTKVAEGVWQELYSAKLK